MDPFLTRCAVERRFPSVVTGANAARVETGAGIRALPRQEQEKVYKWADVSAAYGEA